MRHGCCSTACHTRAGTARAHALHVQTAFRTLLLRTHNRLDCAANAKINLRYSLYTRYQWWSSGSDLTNTVHSRSQARRRGSATQLPCINVAPVPRPLVFRTMGRRHRKCKQAVFSCYTFGRLYCTDKNYAAAIARALANSHFFGGAKLRLEFSLLIYCKACKKRAETSKYSVN